MPPFCVKHLRMCCRRTKNCRDNSGYYGNGGAGLRDGRYSTKYLEVLIAAEEEREDVRRPPSQKAPGGRGGF